MIDEYEQLLAHRRGVSDDVTLDSAGGSAVPAAVRTQASNLRSMQPSGRHHRTRTPPCDRDKLSSSPSLRTATPRII